MKSQALLLSTLLPLAAAAFIPSDRNITCPGDEGHQLYEPKSRKVWVIECDVSHFEGDMAVGGASNRPQADHMKICVGACGRLADCVLAEWESSTGRCSMKWSYGVPKKSEGMWAARLDPDAQLPPPLSNSTASPSGSQSLLASPAASTSEPGSVLWVTETATGFTTHTRTHTVTDSSSGRPVPQPPTAPESAPQEVTVTVTASYSSSTSTSISSQQQATIVSSPIYASRTSSLISTSLSVTSSTTSKPPQINHSPSSLVGSSSAVAQSSTSETPSTPQAPIVGKGKRGVLYNDARFLKNFGGEGSKVTWANNWHSDPYTNQDGVRTDLGQYNQALEYVPQLWNVTFETQFNHNVVAARAGKLDVGSITHMFAFNEPNQCGDGGTCMHKHTDVLVDSYMKTLQPYGKSAKLGSPSPTNGPDGISWLKEFMQMCSGCQIDFVQAHWYAGSDNFVEYLTKFHNAFPDKPLWLTEFAVIGATEKEQIEFLKMAMEWMDKTEWIERYAFFMAKPLGPGDSRSLVNEDGSLTELGKVYNTY